MKRVVWALLFVTIAGAPLSAELKYTLRMEVKKSTSGEPANPMFEMAGQAMMQAMGGEGPNDMTVVMGELGSRTTMSRAMAGTPLGTVTLMKADGTIYGINMADKTYWKQANPMNALPPGMTPKFDIKRTGEFATVVGMKAEKVIGTMTMALPIPEGVELPPGIPRELVVTMEMWTTDSPQYKKYSAPMMQGNAMLKSLGMDKLAEAGLMLKSVIRSMMFGGYQMEQIITAIGEEDVPDSLFEIPAGFKEIPPPGAPSPLAR